MSSAPPAGRIDILIVEDRPVMRAMLREFLESGFPGCLIEDAATARRARDLMVGAGGARVVLMDIGLPDMNGIAFAGELRTTSPGTRVIVVSHHTERIYVERAQEAGVFGFIGKDRIYTELLPLVAQALNGLRGDGGVL